MKRFNVILIVLIIVYAVHIPKLIHIQIKEVHDGHQVIPTTIPGGSRGIARGVPVTGTIIYDCSRAILLQVIRAAGAILRVD